MKRYWDLACDWGLTTLRLIGHGLGFVMVVLSVLLNELADLLDQHARPVGPGDALEQYKTALRVFKASK